LWSLYTREMAAIGLCPLMGVFRKGSDQRPDVPGAALLGAVVPCVPAWITLP